MGRKRKNDREEAFFFEECLQLPDNFIEVLNRQMRLLQKHSIQVKIDLQDVERYTTRRDTDIIDEITEQQIKILVLIEKDNTLSMVSLSKLLNSKLSTVQSQIAILKQKGALRRIDGNRGYWQITPLYRKIINDKTKT